MATTLYVKEGRRYRALLECDERVANALSEGSHLVQVKLHGRTVLHKIDPDWAGVLAVLQTCEDGLIEVIRKASESHLEQRPLTPGELKAFEDWKAATGNRTMKLLFPSALSIFEALRNAVIEGAKQQKAAPRSLEPVRRRRRG